MTNSEPSPESVQHALHANSGGFSSLPSLAALQMVLGALQGEASHAAGMELEEETAADSDRESFGRFRIERELGKGGFGWVFLAMDPTLNRPVALKVPRPNLAVSESMRRSLVSEAQAAAQLDHPHIVPVYEAAEIGSLCYIASAYCSGPTLAEWLRTNGGQVRARTAAAIVICLAEAAAHAHQKGLLHRDIKPSNVMLHDGETIQDKVRLPFVPRLTDFGLAQPLHGGSAAESSVGPIGTPRYMPPEQESCNGNPLGVPADIYSLGAVLLELLTGSPPADRRVEDGSLIRAESLRAQGIPRDLAAVCCRCLAHDPCDRYQSAEALADDLRRFLIGRPVSVRPVSVPNRLFRWARRHPAIAGLCLLLFASGAVGLGVVISHRHQANVLVRENERVAAIANSTVLHSQAALLDLAWMVEESSLWDQAGEGFRQDLVLRLQKTHALCVEQGVDEATMKPVVAAMHSFTARNASFHGANRHADEEFREAIGRWQDLVRCEPDNHAHFRALARVVVEYREHLKRLGESSDQLYAIVLPLETIVSHPESRQTHEVQKARFRILADFAGSLSATGRRASANLVYRWAAVILDDIATAAPEEPGHRLEQARMLQAVRGYTDSPDSAREVAAARAEAFAVVETLCRDYPDQVQYRVELAALHQKQGAGARGRRDFERAVAECETAIELCYQALARHPAEVDAKLILASAARQCAYIHQQLGESEKALVQLKRSCDTWHEVFKSGALPERDLKPFAFACHDLGLLANELGKEEYSAGAFQQGSEAFQKLNDRPRPPNGYLVPQAECLTRAGTYELQAGHTEQAEKRLREALGIWEALASGRASDPNVRARLKAVRKKLAELSTETSAR